MEPLGGDRGRQRCDAGLTRPPGTALAVNAVLVLVMAYTFLDSVRMTYWPGWTFPFGA